MPTAAFANAAVSFSPGDGRVGNRKDSGILTHLHSTRGTDDYWFGYANTWTLWNIQNNYNNRLGFAFAMVAECDWSDELYDHILFRPFYYCTSYCSSNHWTGWWLGKDDGDDNRTHIYIDDREVGTFQGNLINDGSEGEDRHVNAQGWLYHGFYEDSGCDTWLRREGSQKGHRVKGKIDIWNVWHDGIAPSNDIFTSQYAPNNDMSIQTERIYIENDMSIMGGIFKIVPLSAPGLVVDMYQDRWENGKQYTEWANGRQVVLYGDNAGIHQNWMMKPYKGDDRGTFTFTVANMVAPGLDRCLDNRGRRGPSMDPGHTEIWRTGDSVNLTNSWWVHHEPNVCNETDHKCWYLTSDADGQRLDTNGVTSSSSTAISIQSAACPERWSAQRNAQWDIREVMCEGSVGLSSDLALPGDELKILGWHDTDGGYQIKPYNRVRGAVNESEMPVYPIFRLYMTDAPVKVEDDPDAVVMASCTVATWGRQSEAMSHRHIGWPHGGHSIYGLSFRLEGSRYAGSIHYAARRWSGGEWEEGQDGSFIIDTGNNDLDNICQVKVWLTGEIADHYDLEYRTKLLNGNWSEPVYSHSSSVEPLALETAPMCGNDPDGNADAIKISGMNLHLVRKPEGARVVREFSAAEEFTADEAWGPGYLYVGAMLGIRTVAANEQRVWTDRYRGTILSKTPAQLVVTCVEYYADGVDREHMVYRDTGVEEGDVYNPIDAATWAALKDTCNLDAHYGEDPSTGFTGWFLDPELTQPAESITIVKNKIHKLYGRNRCTLRVDYTEDSEQPDGSCEYHVKADDASELTSIGKTDFSKVPERHVLDGIALPAIGDDGEGHKALYYGERLSFDTPDEVFCKLADGTWRRLKPECWFTDSQASSAKVSSITAKRDATIYIKWVVANAEGVEGRRG